MHPQQVDQELGRPGAQELLDEPVLRLGYNGFLQEMVDTSGGSST